MTDKQKALLMVGVGAVATIVVAAMCYTVPKVCSIIAKS